MLHTTLTEAIGSLPIDSISIKRMPRADYYALGHLHINFEIKNNDKPVIYSGPIYPNSFQELEDLCYGRYYLNRVEGFWDIKKHEIRIKDVVCFNIN
ncbi:hypothetical protein FJZ17_03160 [Candidatus Pacearchaeota archaeon]|nr:hypothetical protein [Candidatus Pacearchaeota archaeon]